MGSRGQYPGVARSAAMLWPEPSGALPHAGPIQTEIWGDLVRNAEPTTKKGSVFKGYVQNAHRLSEQECSKPGWFWDSSVVGERIWKVTAKPSVPHLLGNGTRPCSAQHAGVRRGVYCWVSWQDKLGPSDHVPSDCPFPTLLLCSCK